MRIGELAKRGDCDVETVRFYEREGLLDVPARAAYSHSASLGKRRPAHRA